MYSKIVEDAAKTMAEEKALQEKNRKPQRDILEKAASLKPAEVLEKTFEQFLQQKQGKKLTSDVDFKSMLKLEVQAPTLLEESETPRQKNEWPPAGGQGPQQHKAPKGKGNGKGNTTGKGNAKGKGKKGSSSSGNPKGKGSGGKGHRKALHLHWDH